MALVTLDLEALMLAQHAGRREPWRVVVGLVIMLLILGALAAMAVTTQRVADRRPVTASAQPTVTVTVTPPPSPDPCAVVVRRQAAVIMSADPSVAQWRTHVTAMTQLADGELTLRQANQFWDDTQAKAHASITTFQRADTEYLRTGDGGARCATTRLAGDVVLVLTRRVVDQWHTHAMDMDKLDAGQLDPDTALTRWLVFYPRGEALLEAYDAARRTWRP